MADCSLDELLSEVGNLSINDDCLEAIKDFNKKGNNCSLFDGLWSEDDTSVVETSLNLTDLNLTDISSLNFSVDETENVQVPALLSSNNVTVRRKTKTKRHVSEDDSCKNYSSHSKDQLVYPSSPSLDNVTYSSRIANVSIGLENVGLDSFPNNEDERLCRKLNEDFEQAENPNLSITHSFRSSNDLQASLEQKLNITKRESSSKDVEMSIRESDSYEQVCLEKGRVNSAKTEECSGEHISKEAITSSCKENEFDLSSNLLSPVSNAQLQSSDILLLPPKVENQNVFEPKREFDTTNVKQSGSNIYTRCDESLTRCDSLDNNKGYFTRAYDESTISNKCDSPQVTKHPESTNLEHDVAVGSGAQKVSDGNVSEFYSCNTDSAFSFSISPQAPKLKADSVEEISPLQSFRSSSGGAGGIDELSNKENVWKPETKKKVIFLSSDSDSVWEDALDFDDSDCEKYNISLSSRLGNPSQKCNEKTSEEVDTTKVNKGREPITSSKTIQLSDSDDDDDFDDFLDKIKTPKPKSTPRYSLKSFIVDDKWVDSSEDDDLDNHVPFLLTTPKCVTNVPIVTPSTAPAKKTTLETFNKRCFPVKKFRTPSFKTTPLKMNTKGNTPRQTSSGKSLGKIVTPYVNTPHKFWRKSRELLIDELFKCYNETVFNNKLPADLPITWNKQMTKTAGFCYYIGSINKKCRIELSDKVVDSCDRIRDTLIHELCHAATWLIDGVKAGHGPHWKRWAHKAKMAHSDLPPISRCHSYDINYKFTYRCVKCQHSFGRHSKSVNLKTARCPYCLSHLELLPRLNKDGTPAKTRAPTKFSLFVKDNYGQIKAKEPKSSHQEVMKELSKQFALQATLDRENMTKTK